MLNKLLAIGIGSVALHFIISLILAFLLMLTYTSLTEENVVAIIQFDATDKPDVYMAHLFDPQLDKIGDYKLYGEQWRIDAAFTKIAYWANLLGFDSKYALDRFGGRYKKIEDENSTDKKHISYQIEDHNLIDVFSFLVDTNYGSSTYKDIKLHTKFIVLHSPTGLMVREEANKKESSFWQKASSFIN